MRFQDPTNGNNYVTLSTRYFPYGGIEGAYNGINYYPDVIDLDGIYAYVPMTGDDLSNHIPSLKYVNDNFIQSDKVDSLVDVFNSSDPSPSSADSLTLKPDFEFSDEHLMSSLAVKMLLDKLEKRIAALEQS